MAYSEQIVTAVGDIPALIASFAANRGWGVSGTTLTRPGGGRSFEITASIDGTNNRQHRVTVANAAEPTQLCRTQMPWINGTANNPFILTPTKLHLFGNDDPWEGAPWIGVVIECGYNHYRHLYIGNMVKVGDYGGGEIISANHVTPTTSGSGGTYSLTTNSTKFLFSAQHSAEAAMSGDNSGGVFIEHEENERIYRRFHGPTGTNSRLNLNPNMVLGGARDAINSGLVTRGLSDYAGANILVPVNLFATDSFNFSGNDVRFRPIGYPPGVRMINMQGTEPNESIEVGNENWRVFPEFSKRENTVSTYGTSRPDGGAGGYHPTHETSYYLGLAYRED